MSDDLKLEFDITAFETEVSLICCPDVSFTEAIIIWSEGNNVELELISAIIKKNVMLKSRVEEDARSRNLLKRQC